MAEHNDIGRKGEKAASDFLKNKGYKILDLNWRWEKLEADIIALDKDMLVVVEVKTRQTDVFGEPETFVKKQKQKNLIKAAHEYITQKELTYEVRFDIISVLMNKKQTQVNHIENAFSTSH
ncbi:MAG: YraN family protein [Bacteroidia bacterium]|nr:YraN family protein [Bacteroidia bacterium]